MEENKTNNTETELETGMEQEAGSEQENEMEQEAEQKKTGTKKAATKKKAEGKADEGQELVTVKLPKSRDKKDDVFVSVNGMNYKIKRGEKVEIPRYVAAVLEHSEKMDELAIERSDAMADKN